MRSLLVLLALLLLAVPSAASAACHRADVPTPAQGNRAAAAATLCLVNAQRRQHGLRLLRTDARLVRAGAAHARDMVRRRYFSHRSLDGRSPLQRILRTGYGRNRRVTGGENLGWVGRRSDTPRTIVGAWMNSPAHRQVILLPAFRKAGVAAVPGIPVGDGPGTTYALEAGT
jgi:uncharacterized protein YkwD